MLDPGLLLKPPMDAWPTYNGDYSGRRFSSLSQINTSNIKNLNLAWIYRANVGETPGAIVGGEGSAPKPGEGTNSFGGPSIKATPLMVNGILYFTSPNHVGPRTRARAANSGTINIRRTPAAPIGNRGVGMYGNWLFFESPDSNLVSARCADRQGTLESVDRRSQARLHLHSGARGRRQSHHRRHRRRPSGQSRLPAIARSRDRRAAMEVVDHAAQEASPASRPGPTSTLARTARGRPGFPAPTIPN